MASRSNSALGISPTLANAWGMGIGACILLALIAATGQRIVVADDPSYILALVYLAVLLQLLDLLPIYCLSHA